MCLILIAHRMHAQLPLVVAANRDEFHGRPAAAAHWWTDGSGILAGRDLQDGGTWIGVHASGRFAAVTNFSEEPPAPVAAKRSRGELTTNFLRGQIPASAYLAEIAERAHEYRGFNLLLGDGDALHFFGNRDGAPRQLSPGYYGMSNDVLDCAWPKVTGGRSALQAALAPTPEALDGATELGHRRQLMQRLFAVLADRSVPPDDALPKRGRDIELERRVAPSFIASDAYGTRACTVLLRHASGGRGHFDFGERRFGPAARELGRSYASFEVTDQECPSAK